LFNRMVTSLIQYPIGRNGSYVIPSTVHNISDYAFSGSRNLTSVTIPTSVGTIGHYAFRDCSSLYYVLFKGTADPNSSDGTFDGCDSLKFVCVGEGYKNSSFCNQTKLVEGKKNCDIVHSNGGDCYSVIDTGKEFIITKKDNATKWESQSTNCMKFFCDNKGGFASRSLCNSTQMCSNNECISKNNNYVDVKLNDPLTVDDIDADEFAQNISNLTGIDSDSLTVGVDLNDDGHVVSIIILVSDEHDAETITDTMDNTCNFSDKNS